MMPAGASSRTEITVRAFEEQLRAIVGAAHVRPAGTTDSVAGAPAQIVAAPGSEQEICTVLQCANRAGFGVTPRGGGTKLDWGNPPARAELILSMTRLSRILEHAWADLTVTVEAGCTMQKLQETLAQHGQRLALDALWPERATVGGVLATNDSGALRLRFGGLRDLIIGVTLALPDGTLASSGGKVVKNVAGYDLPKLATGALGTLGIITRAIFRLHPLPRNTRTLSVSTGSLEETQRLILAVQDSKLAHTAVQARFAWDAQPEADILFEGTQAGLAAQEDHLRKLAEPASVAEAQATVWAAGQGLWSLSDAGAIAKISVLPADIARTIEEVQHAANTQQVRWKAVVQATGIGWLRLEAAAEVLHATLQKLRAKLERDAGSLVVLHRPAGMAAFEAWGNPGDALELMRAVKHQLDPNGTLNPGRFVGGI